MTGDKDVMRELMALGAAGEETAKAVLGAAAGRIAARAKLLCPVDEIDGGQLRDSIRATKPTRTKAGRISAGVVAGGPKLARLVSEKGHKEPGSYAAIVHEEMTLRHPGGGQAKFIEQPWLEEAPKIPDAMRAALDAVGKR